jgi:hypothetical protein
MTRDPQHLPDPLYLTALRALIHSAAAAILLFGLALPPGLLGGALSAALGVAAARLLHGSRARLGTSLGVALASLLAAALSHALLTGPPLAAQLLGVDNALALTDLLSFSFTFFGLSLALRALADRFPTLALLEVAATTGVVVYLVAGHRDLVISEPRALSDWVWARGGDPILVLMTLGALTLATVPLLLLVRQRALKAALSVSALAFLGLIVFLLLRVDPPTPPDPESLGLSGKPKDGKDQQGNPQGGQGGGQGGKGDNQSPDQMPFRDDYPRGNPTPVAVVLFHDDYSPPGGFYYFRQTAFSQFNGFRLVRSLRRDTDSDLAERFPTEPIQIDDLPIDEPYRVEVPTTVAMVTDHRQPFGLQHPWRLEPVENPNPDYFRRAYRVTSLAPAASFDDMIDLKAGDPDWNEATRLHYTLYPEDDRYEALADEIVAQLQPEYQRSPLAQALAIRRWLEKNSTYTRKTHHASATDPVASFLFGDRRGYCVHLAHAMAFLLRARGIPARVSAGYLADESRRGSGTSVLLQNQDAHAWAELYLDGPGWVVMDVSPEQVDDDEMPQVNQDLQRQLAELARGDKSAGKKTEPTKDQPWARWFGLSFGSFALLLLGGLYAAKLWRRLIWRVGGAKSVSRTCYRAALDLLAEAGQTRAYGESREAFARRLAAQAPTLELMTREHTARALGTQRPPLPPEAWAGHYQALCAQVAASWPAWRRWLGLLNPISWLRVR